MKNHIYFLLVFNLLTSGLAFGKQSESDDAGSHEQADSSLTNRFIWIVYDQIYGASQLDDALSYRPDVIFRGWFKWGNPGPGYGGKSWIPRQADSQGALFGGGGTCSALYPDKRIPPLFKGSFPGIPTTNLNTLGTPLLRECIMGTFKTPNTSILCLPGHTIKSMPVRSPFFWMNPTAALHGTRVTATRELRPSDYS